MNSESVRGDLHEAMEAYCPGVGVPDGLVERIVTAVLPEQDQEGGVV